MEASPLSLPDAGRVRAALARRRERLGATWCGPATGLADGVVVVPAGLVIPVEGSDHHYPYRVHDDHHYLSGARRPAQVLAFDPQQGAGADAWTLFAPVATQDDRVWHGDVPDLDAQARALGLTRVRPLDEVGAWLAARAKRPVALLGNLDLLERPAGYTLHPEQVAALALDAELTDRIQESVVASRRRKDDVELEFLRAAAAASHAGHLQGLRGARAGMTERRLQVEIDAAFLRAGAERAAYDTIAASGPNAAVLHATPGARALTAGDLVLVDAGAEVGGYDGDVTRTWPVAPTFTGLQRAVHDLVLEVQARAIHALRPGVEYRDLHLRACRDIAQGLVELGWLRGNADALVERDAHALFFPHGLGHLLGLGTHDVGGYLAGRARSERPGLKYLRTDCPMEAGYVVTIEPGVYVVPALLQDEALRRRYADAVDWARVDGLLEFGGVRIEDDVHVRDGEAEVLTAAIPRAAADLEALRA